MGERSTGWGSVLVLCGLLGCPARNNLPSSVDAGATDRVPIIHRDTPPAAPDAGFGIARFMVTLPPGPVRSGASVVLADFAVGPVRPARFQPDSLPRLFFLRMPRDRRGALALALIPHGGEVIDDGVTRGVQTNDPEIGQQWGLENPGGSYSGATPWVADVDIDAPCAWTRLVPLCLCPPRRDVFGLMLDTGVAAVPDLANVVALPPGAPGGPRGTDFVDGDNDPAATTMTTDDPLTLRLWSHGTMSVGIAAARTNNGIGIAGVVGPQAGTRFHLAVARVLNGEGTDPLEGTVGAFMEGMYYAVALGEWLQTPPRSSRLAAVNLSLVFSDPPTNKQRWLVRVIVSALALTGTLVVAATGDMASDGGLCGPIYPSTMPAPNVLAVGGVLPDGTYSYCFDPAVVPVGAPAFHQRAPTITGTYDVCSGTSCAAPVATGVAMMIALKYPDVSAAGLRQRIVSTAVQLPELQAAFSHGMINACAALTP